MFPADFDCLVLDPRHKNADTANQPTDCLSLLLCSGVSIVKLLLGCRPRCTETNKESDVKVTKQRAEKCDEWKKMWSRLICGLF